MHPMHRYALISRLSTRGQYGHVFLFRFIDEASFFIQYLQYRERMQEEWIDSWQQGQYVISLLSFASQDGTKHRTKRCAKSCSGKSTQALHERSIKKREQLKIKSKVQGIPRGHLSWISHLFLVNNQQSALFWQMALLHFSSASSPWNVSPCGSTVHSCRVVVFTKVKKKNPLINILTFIRIIWISPYALCPMPFACHKKSNEMPKKNNLDSKI